MMEILKELDRIIAEENVSIGCASVLGNIRKAVEQLKQENERLTTMHKVNTVDLIQAEKKYNDLIQRMNDKYQKWSTGSNVREVLKDLLGEELKQSE